MVSGCGEFSVLRLRQSNTRAWLRGYQITPLNPEGRTRKIEVKCYGNVLGADREHPEAKFLGHDGKPCESDTRRLLRRSHIIEKRRRYIGKETSRRWEQGDDISMVDFRVCGIR